MTDDDFLSKIVGWAKARSDIFALIMTGSRAQPAVVVDSYSDYDLEIFTSTTAQYTSGSDWMTEIDAVWVYLATESSRGCPTRLVIFERGKKVDFSILPVSELEAAVAAQQRNDLYEQGYRVLVDKRGIASRLPLPSYTPSARLPPTESEFRATVDEFWFEAWHIPKYIERGDLWVVKFRDWTMKRLLLRMLEWHAIAANAHGLELGQIGTRMKDWTRPDLWKRLHEAFGHFDGADSMRALTVTASLFRDVAVETAARLGYTYPRLVDDSISGYIAGLPDSRTDGPETP